MSDRNELKDPQLWERISRTAETVRSLPAWSKGSERNERSDEAEHDQVQTCSTDEMGLRKRA
jgi:hypothetical protein